MPDTITFRLPNDLAEVPRLRDQFERACRSAGVPEEERQGAMLVLTELVNNALEHGCKAASDCVEGYYRITEGTIEVEVTDPGEVLTVESFSTSDASDFSVNGRGAGLFLIQALTDEIDVHRTPQGGTTVHVVKRRFGGGAA